MDDTFTIYPYRDLQIGDEIKIRSRAWYNCSKDVTGFVKSPGVGINTLFTPMHARMCGQEVKITSIENNGYTVCGSELLWQEWMFYCIYTELWEREDWFPIFLITGHMGQ